MLTKNIEVENVACERYTLECMMRLLSERSPYCAHISRSATDWLVWGQSNILPTIGSGLGPGGRGMLWARRSHAEHERKYKSTINGSEMPVRARSVREGKESMLTSSR